MNIHKILKSAPKIGVFGSDGDHATVKVKRIACEVGRLLAERGAIVITGGGDGIMIEASRGASESGGVVIAISPWEYPVKAEANGHSTIVIPTGIGFARSQILTNTIDGAILVGGGIGTLQEATMTYWLRKPTVAITSSGGMAEKIAGTMLDERKLPPILKAKDAQGAVKLLFEKIKKR